MTTLHAGSTISTFLYLDLQAVVNTGFFYLAGMLFAQFSSTLRHSKGAVET